MSGYKEMHPATVQDLVDVASSGKWVEQYEATEDMTRTLP